MSSLLGGKPDTSAMEKQIQMQRQETERLRQQAETERRDLAEQMSAKRMARSRGGSRMLLSEARLNPESGVDETLGGAV